MNGFVVRDASDVEKQELFIEHPGDFIIAKHLPLKHRWSEAAADSDGNCSGEEAEGRTTHDLHLVWAEDPLSSEIVRMYQNAPLLAAFPLIDSSISGRVGRSGSAVLSSFSG